MKRTIKTLTLLIGTLLLVTSCYTQLALVEHRTYADQEDYYYPATDTLYGGSATIVQNFYGYPPRYDTGLYLGFYDDWWWWNSFYTGFGPYWGLFYPVRPVFLYPIFYDPFYSPYYDDYWWWYNTSPSYGYGSVPYGPRPFPKHGMMARGGKSKRIRISQPVASGGAIRVDSGSEFLPVRNGPTTVTKRPIRKTNPSKDRELTSDSRRTIKGKSSPAISSKTKRSSHIRSSRKSGRVVKGTVKHQRKYYKMTQIRSLPPRQSVKQPEPVTQKRIRQTVRSPYKKNNQSAYRTRFNTTRSSSPAYRSSSSPSRSSSFRSPARSSSSSRATRSATRSSTRSAKRK